MKRRYRRGIGKSTGKGPKRPAVAEVAEGGDQQIEDRRSDMINDKECNHSEAIAKDMYYAFLENQKEGTNWEGLSDDDKAGWRNVAEQALPIIAKHAANDIRVYLDLKASVATGWKKWLYWAGVGIVGAILGGLGMSLSGCGHSVNVTPDRAEVCKDGACLVLEPGRVSFSQVQPVSDVSPVVQGEEK